MLNYLLILHYDKIFFVKTQHKKYSCFRILHYDKQFLSYK